jgi:hypothetical protein
MIKTLNHEAGGFLNICGRTLSIQTYIRDGSMKEKLIF